MAGSGWNSICPAFCLLYVLYNVHCTVYCIWHRNQTQTVASAPTIDHFICSNHRPFHLLQPQTVASAPTIGRCICSNRDRLEIPVIFYESVQYENTFISLDIVLIDTVFPTLKLITPSPSAIGTYTVSCAELQK